MSAKGKKIVMVIAHENFRDEELFHTQDVLEKDGAIITLASTSTGTATGMLGGTAEVDITIDEVDESDYDAIVFIGGGGSSIYYRNEKALVLAQRFFEAGKTTAAICIAPGILAAAGILTGKKATIWNGDGKHDQLIETAGGTFTGKDVEKSGNIITANGPQAAKKFGAAIADSL